LTTHYGIVIIIYTSWVGLTPNYPTESYILFTALVLSRTLQSTALWRPIGSYKMVVSFVTE